MILPNFSDEFLAAFLGFLSAMFVEFIFRRMDTRTRAKRVAKELVEELQVNKAAVNILDDEQAYVSPYQLSSWKGAQFTGSISELRGVKGAKNLLHAFSTIEEASILERSLFVAYLLSDGQPDGKGWRALRKETMESRNLVRKTINAALAEWEDSDDGRE